MCVRNAWLGVSLFYFISLYFFSGRFKSLCVSAHQLNCQPRSRVKENRPKKSSMHLHAAAAWHSLFVRLTSIPEHIPIAHMFHPMAHPLLHPEVRPKLLWSMLCKPCQVWIKPGGGGEGLLGSVALWPSSLAK